MFDPWLGTKISHATGQLNPHGATRETHVPQLKSPHTATAEAMHHNEDPVQPKFKKKKKKPKPGNKLRAVHRLNCVPPKDMLKS